MSYYLTSQSICVLDAMLEIITSKYYVLFHSPGRRAKKCVQCHSAGSSLGGHVQLIKVTGRWAGIENKGEQGLENPAGKGALKLFMASA